MDGEQAVVGTIINQKPTIQTCVVQVIQPHDKINQHSTRVLLGIKFAWDQSFVKLTFPKIPITTFGSFNLRPSGNVCDPTSTCSTVTPIASSLF